MNVNNITQKSLFLSDYAGSIANTIPSLVEKVSIERGELVLEVVPSSLINTLTFLRDHTSSQFKILSDMSGVDYPSREERFEVVYNLLSFRYNSRIRVKVKCSETSYVPSCTSLFSSAGWQEREVWDMYGIYFDGNKDLRRILTDYGFEGFPLRKDFPLSGYTEVRYDEEAKRIVTEPLETSQEFRYFDYTSPWEQVRNIS